MHEVASVEDQVNVELPPLSTVSGLAPMVTVGGTEATVTVTDWVAEPPSPKQVMSNSVVASSAPVGCDPLMGTWPVQPPDAWHDVAFWAFQVSVELAPLAIVVGSALSAIVGISVTTTSADCVAVPAAPVQVRPNVVVAVSGAMVLVPEVGCSPLQPPDAMQLSTFFAFQERVVAAPGATVAGLGCNDIWGCPFGAFELGEIAEPPQAASVSSTQLARVVRICDATELFIITP